MNLETHDVEIPPELAGERLDVAIAQLLPQYSRSRLQRWIDEGRVTLDARAPSRRELVSAGQRVQIQALFEADDRVTAGSASVPFEILHRDAAVYVINKPAGLVVHPGAGNRSGTLQNALLQIDPDLARVPRAGIVHRLDKDTSGLLVVARTPAAQAVLVRALAEREVGREYLALCLGVLTGGGTIDEPIGRHRTQRTLLRVQLETGRTHQIRVHLAHIGYPIVGDPLYGGRRRLPAGASPTVIDALAQFRRQALHAARLSFEHPSNKRELSFEAPIPADFRDLLTTLAAEASTT